MKKCVMYSFILAVTFLMGFSFYSYSPTGISEAKVLDLVNQFHQAEKNRDKEKLKEILANNISWSRYKDERFSTKEQIIENVTNAECEVEGTEMTFVFTEVEANKVEVFFIMRQKFLWAEGNRTEHNADYIYTFEKQQNEWKLTKIHLEN